MNAAWGLLAVFTLVCRVESRCSPTSYYKNCWIRRFPGIFIDIEESQRRGAQLLKHYQEETALKCSRTCCLTRNFSCNLAIFHYDTTQEILNCFHLHCPTLGSCILKPLLSDKRQFIHPPPPVKPSTTAGRVHAPTEASVIATTALQSTGQPLAVSTTTTAVPSTEKTPPSSKKYAQTTAAVVSTTSLPDSITPSPSFTTVSTLGHYNSKILSAFSTTSPQSPVSTPTRHPTATFSQLASSPPTSAALISYTESSKLYLNETKGNHGRNHTVSNEGASGDDTLPGLGHGWYVAADTLLVAVAICITVLLSCCCSILLVVSWRGQRKRMGRYSTSWRGKRGSMRLIKYVLVKESS
uniref:MANSC domain containing 4 n=1 Tax=Maylandia zebra TaxID=106582 RepID=A0A3P9BUX4_9CICH